MGKKKTDFDTFLVFQKDWFPTDEESDSEKKSQKEQMWWRTVSSFKKSSLNSQKAVIPMPRKMTALPESQILEKKIIKAVIRDKQWYTINK